MKFKFVKIVAFDFCDTLAELKPSPAGLVHDFISRTFGISLSQENIREAIFDVSNIIPYSSLSVSSSDERRKFYDRYNSTLLDRLGFPEEYSLHLFEHFERNKGHWKLKDGVVEALTNLRSSGIRVVLASNFDDGLRQILTDSGHMSLFDALYISGSMGHEKPSISFYEEILRSERCQGWELLMVGDSLNLDIIPALSVGMQAMLYSEHLAPSGIGASIHDNYGVYWASSSFGEISNLFCYR